MVIKSPAPFTDVPGNVFRVFLSGSIETAGAFSWQEKLEDIFGESTDILLLNPRRDDWDKSWIEDIEDSRFRHQVNWELDAMDAADLIVMYFAPGTQSPVTLLELGLYAGSGKLAVCCSAGFSHKGNVDIVCTRYKIEQVQDIAGLKELVCQRAGKRP